MFFDLDGFKSVNDNCGHAEGDRPLQNLAPMVQQENDDHHYVIDYSVGTVTFDTERYPHSFGQFGNPSISVAMSCAISAGISMGRKCVWSG